MHEDGCFKRRDCEVLGDAPDLEAELHGPQVLLPNQLARLLQHPVPSRVLLQVRPDLGPGTPLNRHQQSSVNASPAPCSHLLLVCYSVVGIVLDTLERHSKLHVALRSRGEAPGGHLPGV